MHRLTPLLLVLVLATACGSPEVAITPTVIPSPVPTPSCRETAAPYVDAVRSLFDEWNDASQVASSTARIALSGPVSELQALRRQAEALDVPLCAERAQAALLKHMDGMIESYLLFMRQENTWKQEDLMAAATKDIEMFGLLFAELRSEGH